jgi:flagellar motor switch protein FliN/FliY
MYYGGSYMENISKEQADAIGEVANICIGSAATALSVIINRSTRITTPVVDILSDDFPFEGDEHILVKIPYTRGLDGTNLMLLEVHDALTIANLMTGGDGTDVSGMQIDELTLSAISEAMNQMCGAIATTISSLMKTPTDIGFPLINYSHYQNFQIPAELCNGSDIVKVKFHLSVAGLIDSELIQLYPISLIKQILKQEVV